MCTKYFYVFLTFMLLTLIGAYNSFRAQVTTLFFQTKKNKRTLIGTL